MPSITLAGYYGFGNAGDELLLQALLGRLRSENPQKTIVVLSRNPTETARTFNVQATQRWNPIACLFAFFRSDTFILGGGGLLQEVSGALNHVYYLALVVLAKLCGCQTRLVAMGVDPMGLPMNRWLTRTVINHFVDELSVRDVASRKILQDVGVQLDPVLVRDPVFELVQRSPKALAPRFAVVLSRPDSIHEDVISAWLSEIHQTIGVPIDLLVLYAREDQAVAKRVADRSGAIERLRVLGNPADLLRWIPEYSWVIGSRFHALVIAAANDTPFAGWGGQLKIQSLCQEFGMPYSAKIDLNVLKNQFKSPNKTGILAT